MLKFAPKPALLPASARVRAHLTMHFFCDIQMIVLPTNEVHFISFLIVINVLNKKGRGYMTVGSEWRLPSPYVAWGFENYPPFDFWNGDIYVISFVYSLLVCGRTRAKNLGKVCALTLNIEKKLYIIVELSLYEIKRYILGRLIKTIRYLLISFKFRLVIWDSG